MKNKKLQDWVICGRLIGQASDWDQLDTWVMLLNDFTPYSVDYVGPMGDISIDFENGTINSFDEEGNVLSSQDLIDVIGGLPRRKVEA